MDKITEVLRQNAEILQMLTKQVTKDAAGTPSAVQLHGLGGLFSGAGIENPVLSAIIRPQGLGAALRRYSSVVEDPRFSAITGFTSPTGSRPTASCDDAQKAYMKSCELTAQFGLNRFDTQEIEMDKTMLRANRGDRMDLRLAGHLLGDTGFSPEGLSEEGVLNVVTKAEMVVAGAQLERQIAGDLWTGAVASGSFPGLDNQIATGQTDARTGNACPALDSDVKDFNYGAVDGSAPDIVDYLSMMAKYLDFNASRSGLAPITHAVAMRAELWFELSAVWPCKFATHRCTTIGGDHQVITDGRENVNLTNAMRVGNYIDINGRRYPVVIDDGIYEATNITDGNLEAAQYASSIYFVPLSAIGGLPITFMEYLDYRKATLDASLLRGKAPFWWTDNGMYSWSITEKKWCYQLHLKAEPRVVLRAPQLAGKIQNVKYEPLQHFRSGDPDSPYYFDGGASVIGSPTRYAVWM